MEVKIAAQVLENLRQQPGIATRVRQLLLALCSRGAGLNHPRPAYEAHRGREGNLCGGWNKRLMRNPFVSGQRNRKLD